MSQLKSDTLNPLIVKNETDLNNLKEVSSVFAEFHDAIVETKSKLDCEEASGAKITIKKLEKLVEAAKKNKDKNKESEE